MENKQLQDIFGKFLLVKSLVSAQYTISKEDLNMDLEEYVNYNLNKLIAEKINKITDSPSKEETYDQIIYTKSFYVFNPKYFKEVFETMMRMLPEEKLKEIRNV